MKKSLKQALFHYNRIINSAHVDDKLVEERLLHEFSNKIPTRFYVFGDEGSNIKNRINTCPSKFYELYKS